MDNENSKQNERAEVVQILDASREQVWHAFTDPVTFAAWWCPDGFTATCELDVRMGGVVSVEMVGPDGTKYPSTGTYKEVTAPDKLSFLQTPLNAAGEPIFEVLQTAVFSDEEGGSKTKLVLTNEVLSQTPEAAPYLAGMAEGLNQCVAKLARLLAADSGANEPDTTSVPTT